jgi:hypothetical protein
MQDETRRELTILSKHLRRTKSNVLRWLIHQEYLRQGFHPIEVDGIPSAANDDEGVHG